MSESTTYESIRVGMQPDDVSAAARAILSALSNSSTATNPQLQSDATSLTDANTDPKLRQQREEENRRELASAPPALPDFSKLDVAQQKVAVEKYIADKDTYLQGLMDRPAGAGFTKIESRTLAGAALAALRDSGMRI